jgi:hypothetical protein
LLDRLTALFRLTRPFKTRTKQTTTHPLSRKQNKNSAGLALRLLAAAYPSSAFTGYDVSTNALALARADAANSGLSNLTFSNPLEPGGALPEAPTLDFVLVNDALHDMTRPDLVCLDCFVMLFCLYMVCCDVFGLLWC